MRSCWGRRLLFPSYSLLLLLYVRGFFFQAWRLEHTFFSAEHDNGSHSRSRSISLESAPTIEIHHEHNENLLDESINNATPNTTLALLYPPGIIGGYRNQVMRFIAFVNHARKNNLTQLLLPSLLWSTTYVAANDERAFYPIPMDQLFDIGHWNSFAPRDLPTIVPTISQSDCWGRSPNDIPPSPQQPQHFVSPWADTLLQHHALLTPIRNGSRAMILGQVQLHARRFDWYPLVEHCVHPVVYGGGKGGGRLWNQYLWGMPQVQPGSTTSTTLEVSNTQLIANISRALRPHVQWRTVAQACVAHGQQQQLQQQQQLPYMALHARVEVDMLVHKCGQGMEKNLTTIFRLVEDWQQQQQQQHENTTSTVGLFVAVSRRGMQQPLPPISTPGPRGKQQQQDQEQAQAEQRQLQAIVTENYRTLLQRMSKKTSSSLFSTPAFECGEAWIHQWYRDHVDDGIPFDYFGSLLPSLVNYYIATQAAVFVGVEKSSWSTDVWTHRYHEGRGSSNYMYSPEGIRPVPNGGLPPIHTNCDKKKMKT